MNSFDKIIGNVRLEWTKICQNELVKYIFWNKLTDEQQSSLAYNLLFLEKYVQKVLIQVSEIASDHRQSDFLLEIDDMYKAFIEEKHYLKQLASQNKFDKTVFEIVKSMCLIVKDEILNKNYWQSLILTSFLIISPYEQIKSSTSHLNKKFVETSDNKLGKEWFEKYNSSRYRAIYAKLLNNIKDSLHEDDINYEMTGSLEKMLVLYLRFLNHSFIKYDFEI